MLKPTLYLVVTVFQFIFRETRLQCKSRDNKKIYKIHIEKLFRKSVDIFNRTRIMHHRLIEFYINHYQLLSTKYTQYDSVILIMDWYMKIGYEIV